MCFPHHWYRGTRNVLPLTTLVSLDLNTPSKAWLCIMGFGGGRGASEKGWIAYPKKKKRWVSEWSCVSSAQELWSLTHTHTHTEAYSSFVGRSMPFLTKNKCVGLWWMVWHPPPPPKCFIFLTPNDQSKELGLVQCLQGFKGVGLWMYTFLCKSVCTKCCCFFGGGF